MTREDILYEAIKIAEKRGYKEHLKYLPIIINKNIDLDKLVKNIFWHYKNEIIYSHEFAKAYFGNSDKIYRNKAWVYHLKRMSYCNDDIEYLKNNIPCLD